MKYFLFGLILAALVLVIQSLFSITLLAAEHSTTVITVGFGITTGITSIFLCGYAVMGYRFIKSPLMVKHPQMFTK